MGTIFLVYNAVKKKHTKPATNIQHRVDRETPLAIYIALKVYGATEHSRESLNRLHELVICVSYDRVSKAVANSVIKMFEAEGVPCGPTLRKGLFTVGTADNIDSNPSNHDAKDALHGTGCALTQLPTSGNTGTMRSAEQYRESARAMSSIARLPQFYTNMKEVEVITESKTAPSVSGLCRPSPSVHSPTSNTLPPAPSQTVDGPQTATNLPSSEDTSSSSSVKEQWVTHAQAIMTKSNLNHDDIVSWAALCASNQLPCDRLPCSTSMLPVFRNKASTSAMIYHAMSLIKASIENLNPGQTPVIMLDQPLYAIAKAIQWNPTTEFSEDNYCVFLGPLHSEMLILKLLGDWLRDSSWIAILIDAEVTTPGRAEAMLKGSHIKSQLCHFQF